MILSSLAATNLPISGRAISRGAASTIRCAKARVILVGDYHAVPAYADYTAELLQRLIDHGANPSLGVEFVFARQQPSLDRYMAGEIDTALFHERIHYAEEWGYPWSGVERMLTVARKGGAAVHAGTSGVAHNRFADERACLQAIRTLMSFLPSNNLEDTPLRATDDPHDREADELDSIIPDSPAETIGGRKLPIRKVRHTNSESRRGRAQLLGTIALSN